MGAYSQGHRGEMGLRRTDYKDLLCQFSVPRLLLILLTPVHGKIPNSYLS